MGAACKMKFLMREIKIWLRTTHVAFKFNRSQMCETKTLFLHVRLMIVCGLHGQNSSLKCRFS